MRSSMLRTLRIDGHERELSGGLLSSLMDHMNSQLPHRCCCAAVKAALFALAMSASVSAVSQDPSLPPESDWQSPPPGARLIAPELTGTTEFFEPRPHYVVAPN